MPPETHITPDAIAVITQINQKTKHVWLFTKMGNGLLIFLELSCYLLMISLILYSFYMPTGEVLANRETTDNLTVDTTLKFKEIIDFFMLLKIGITLLGLLMLVPALLFRKVRKKNNLLEEINGITAGFLKVRKHEDSDVY